MNVTVCFLLKVNKNKVIFLYHALIRIAVSQFNFGSKFLSKIEKTYFSFYFNYHYYENKEYITDSQEISKCAA